MFGWLKNSLKWSYFKRRGIASLPDKLNANDNDSSNIWWGRYSIEVGQSKFWKIGKVTVCLDRFLNSWHINYYELEQFERNTSKTFTFKTQKEVIFKPILACKPVVSKLESPLYIPPGENITIYLSSPVWIQVETGKPSFVLAEIPSEQIKETWFGINNHIGDFCFAATSKSMTNIEDVNFSPDKTITPVYLCNKSSNVICLEQICVPVPYLSVFLDDNGNLWTEQINLVYRNNREPKVSVGSGPPLYVKNPLLINLPRKKFNSNSITSFFNN